METKGKKNKGGGKQKIKKEPEIGQPPKKKPVKKPNKKKNK
jgi:hypothetical protein